MNAIATRLEAISLSYVKDPSLCFLFGGESLRRQHVSVACMSGISEVQHIFPQLRSAKEMLPEKINWKRLWADGVTPYQGILPLGSRVRLESVSLLAGGWGSSSAGCS